MIVVHQQNNIHYVYPNIENLRRLDNTNIGESAHTAPISKIPLWYAKFPPQYSVS
jgi:hypothetical protein